MLHLKSVNIVTLFIVKDAKLRRGVSVPDIGAGRCLGPEGNGVSLGERGEGGPGPPKCRGNKQSTLSEEGGNMEKEEEGRSRV